MKRLLVTITAILMLQSIGSVLAKDQGGKRVGNGGGAIVCRDKNDNTKVIYASMYDNWEWKRLGIKESNATSATAIVKNVLSKIKKSNKWLYKDLSKEVKFVQKTVDIFVKNYDVILTRVYDSKHVFMPRFCPNGDRIRPDFGQVVNYRDNSVFGSDVSVSKELMEKFSETSKASLYLHEALYKLLRKEYGHNDSVLARKLNAHMLAWGLNTISDDDASKVMKEILNGDYQKYSGTTIVLKELTYPLANAIRSGNSDSLTKTLRKVITVNGKTYSISSEQKSNSIQEFRSLHLNQPLIEASATGNLEKLNKALAMIVTIDGNVVTPTRSVVVNAVENFKKKYLTGPLMDAASSGNIKQFNEYVYKTIVIAGIAVRPHPDTIKKALAMLKHNKLTYPFVNAIESCDANKMAALLRKTITTHAGTVAVSSETINKEFRGLMNRFVTSGHSNQTSIQKVKSCFEGPAYSIAKYSGKRLKNLQNNRVADYTEKCARRDNRHDYISLDCSFMRSLASQWNTIPNYYWTNGTYLKKSVSYKRALGKYKYTALMFASHLQSVRLVKIILSKNSVNRHYIAQPIRVDGRVSASAYKFSRFINGDYNKQKQIKALLSKRGVRHVYDARDCLSLLSHEFKFYKGQWKGVREFLGATVIMPVIGTLFTTPIAIKVYLPYNRARHLIRYIKVSRSFVKGKVSEHKLIKTFKRKFLKWKKRRRIIPGKNMTEKAKFLANIFAKNSMNGKLCRSYHPLSAKKIRRMIRRGQLK